MKTVLTVILISASLGLLFGWLAQTSDIPTDVCGPHLTQVQYEECVYREYGELSW